MIDLDDKMILTHQKSKDVLLVT